MSLVFKAICSKNTFILKTLIEMMSQISSVESVEGNNNSIKQLSLKVTKHHIELYSDTKKVVTASATLEKIFFSEYYFNDESALCIGISLDLLKSCFKNINRNDVLSISILKEEYNEFPSIISFTFNENKGFDVKFNLVQNIENNNYDDYFEILSLESHRFANLYKEVGGIKKRVKLLLTEDKLQLTSSMIDIATNWVFFNRSDANTRCTNPRSGSDETPVHSVHGSSETNASDTRSSIKFPEAFLRSEYFKITSKISTLDHSLKFNLNSDTNILLTSNILNLRESKQVLGYMYINILTSLA